jgi:enterochelin esterase-like enzyme
MKPTDNPWPEVRTMNEKDRAMYAWSMDGDEPYVLGPDSLERDDVPRGRVLEREWTSHHMYPGTHRKYWIYVPEQLRAGEPSNLIVFQDGDKYLDRAFSATVALDNLIASGDIAPTVAVFVNYGTPGPGNMWGGSDDRQIEYDAVDPDYARFLLEEILPAVAAEVPITDDPERRAICGHSSGGICSFTVAWHRPDAFRRVISHCGSFLDILGGHDYPSKIRLAEPKPIRVLLQTGSKDLDISLGSIPIANQDMLAALTYSGYDVRYEFGEGGHTLLHGAAIFPDTLRWIFGAG